MLKSTTWRLTYHKPKWTRVNIGMIHAAVVLIGVVPVRGTFMFVAKSFSLWSITVREMQEISGIRLGPMLRCLLIKCSWELYELCFFYSSVQANISRGVQCSKGHGLELFWRSCILYTVFEWRCRKQEIGEGDPIFLFSFKKKKKLWTETLALIKKVVTGVKPVKPQKGYPLY